MKDSKFIELLNLYVDHEITREEAALLEAEIQRDPERRRVYREYCQMQKACTLLTDSFRTEAPAPGKVVEFAPRSPLMQWATYASGALAAAACLAVVMMYRHNSATTVKPASTPAIASTTTAPQARVALQPAFAANPREAVASELSLASTGRNQFEWINRVQLDRLPAPGQLWFETRPTLQPQDLSLPSRRSIDPR